MQLCTRQADGSTLAQHLLAAQAATGHADALLQATPPAAGLYLWGVWLALHQSRGSSGMGAPAPVTLQDMAAWQQVYRAPLAPWEAETLQAMDRAALATMADEQQAQRAAAPRHRHGGH